MDAPPLPPPPGQVPAAAAWAPPPPPGPPAFRYASFWSRLGAYLIDALVLIPLSLPFAIAIWGKISDEINRSLQTSEPIRYDAILRQHFGWAILVVAGTYAYQVLMIRYFGATVGKLAVGIRVRIVNGMPCGWREALLRPLLQLIVGFGSFVPGAGLITLLDDLWMLWDRQRQTLHDKVANTIVVYVS
jgi:uncharacterized RDD family membrane protein YckC